ncbi:hypothetical protein [Caulobacter sp. UC70_42]|uniref:hypothetical protein n=1 Tax=Caulobacter sp. UC70_42 TaxID=3374551 RepID=UPI0037572160
MESLIAWRGDAAGDKLFACSGSDIYDVTTDDPLGSAVYSSAINARWRSTNFANDAGAWAIAVNGANTPQKYDGTSFTDAAITGTAGSITLDDSDLSQVMAHKRRLFFIEGDTLRVWYLPVLAVQGAAELLDLGPIFDLGGQLVAEGTWSLDGGQGMDDMAVFVTSEGQIAVYQGLDPSDADNWSLVGVYNIGKPIGDNSLIKWGSDLAIMTQDGIIPLSQALNKDRTEANKIALTAKIATAFSTAWNSYGDLYGWSGTLYRAAVRWRSSTFHRLNWKRRFSSCSRSSRALGAGLRASTQSAGRQRTTRSTSARRMASISGTSPPRMTGTRSLGT